MHWQHTGNQLSMLSSVKNTTNKKQTKKKKNRLAFTRKNLSPSRKSTPVSLTLSLSQSIKAFKHTLGLYVILVTWEGMGGGGIDQTKATGWRCVCGEDGEGVGREELETTQRFIQQCSKLNWTTHASCAYMEFVCMYVCSVACWQWENG